MRIEDCMLVEKMASDSNEFTFVVIDIEFTSLVR